MRMADPETTDEPFEVDHVVRYKLERFRELGFNLRQRKQLIRAGADHHEAEKLIGAGCPLDVAFDILS